MLTALAPASLQRRVGSMDLLNMVVPLGLRPASSLDAATATTVQRRNLLQTAYATAPVFLLTGLQGAAAVLWRLAGRPHPHDWTLPEELLITLMRTLLEYGDIAVWRGFFKNVSRPISMPSDLVMSPAPRPGSKSLWFALRPELRVVEPRGSVNILFIHGGRESVCARACMCAWACAVGLRVAWRSARRAGLLDCT
jgi:hypothetical protein